MAKQATPAATNGFDRDKVKGFVNRINNLKEDLEKERGASMRRCKDIREDIKGVFAEAKDVNIPVKPLKAVIKARELERRAAAQRDGLADSDEMDKFDLLQEALGPLAGTPLGMAAVRAVA